MQKSVTFLAGFFPFFLYLLLRSIPKGWEKKHWHHTDRDGDEQYLAIIR